MGLYSLRRLRYKKRVRGTTLEHLWLSKLPAGGANWLQVPFMVADCEMSSLHAHAGELLSIAWVVVREGKVRLGESNQLLLNPGETVGQSAAIHHLRDCELKSGLAKEAALEAFLAVAAGKVLVFHNAVLDMAFLNKVSLQYFDAPLLLPTIDTMQIERRWLQRRDQPLKPGDLRLEACRQRYGLPRYPVHNALMDAVATAELLLAQACHRSSGKPMKLSALR